MIIESARYENGELHIRCSPRDGIQSVYKIEPGKDYDIVPHKEKRSLDANAYAWVLIGKIAEEIRRPPIEVYRKAIEDTGGAKAEIICIRDTAAPAFIKTWELGHLGRICEQFPSSTPGFVNIRCVYGSSDYNTKEMSALIDTLVQDAQELGIETMPPDKLERMLTSWKE